MVSLLLLLHSESLPRAVFNSASGLHPPAGPHADKPPEGVTPAAAFRRFGGGAGSQEPGSQAEPAAGAGRGPLQPGGRGHGAATQPPGPTAGAAGTPAGHSFYLDGAAHRAFVMQQGFPSHHLIR